MCNDSTFENDSIETINDIFICADCMRVIVQRVVDGRDSFPPKINRREFIKAACTNKLSNTLGHALFEQYVAAERENGVALVDRIYCQCGTFVAKRLKSAEGDTSSAVCECCNDLCHRPLCLFCSTMIDGFDPEDDHSCREKIKAHEDAQQKLLDARERGAEYQICPNQDCKRVVNLQAACRKLKLQSAIFFLSTNNHLDHISCHCGTNFCYSFGAESDHYDHWGPGECPQYPGEPPLPPRLPVAGQIRQIRQFFRGERVVLMQTAIGGPANGGGDVDFEDFAAPHLQEWAAARDNANNNNDNDNDHVATEELLTVRKKLAGSPLPKRSFRVGKAPSRHVLATHPAGLLDVLLATVRLTLKGVKTEMARRTKVVHHNEQKKAESGRETMDNELESVTMEREGQGAWLKMSKLLELVVRHRIIGHLIHRNSIMFTRGVFFSIAEQLVTVEMHDDTSLTIYYKSQDAEVHDG